MTPTVTPQKLLPKVKFLNKLAIIFSIFVSSIAISQEFPDKRLPVDENIWTSNEFVNAQRGRDIVIRRLPKDNSPCNTPDKCPPAIVIDVEKGNTNVKGKLNADAIYVGGEPIINQAGQWVGSTENLRGPTGPQGPQGVKGDSCKIEQDYIVCGDIKVALETLRGPKGDRGAQGIQGPQGARGPEGPEGPQGAVGPIGPQGLTGAKGNPGESCRIESGFVNCGGFKVSLEELRGPRGFQGEKGERGEAGAQGLSGIQGLKGDKGDTGSQGSKGEQGEKGGTGAQGPKGDQGEKGPEGPKGTQGLKGDTGLTGPEGPRGPAGFQKCEVVKASSSKLPEVGIIEANCNTTATPTIVTGGSCWAGDPSKLNISFSFPVIDLTQNPSTGKPLMNKWGCRFIGVKALDDSSVNASAVCCSR